MAKNKRTKDSNNSDLNKAVSQPKDTKGSKFKKNIANSESSSGGNDVLLNLPAGLKYKLPGKRQRVIIGSIVVGLNLLLVIAVVVYFYNPAFQDFIYNVGRE
tara:strand:+ start:568 stop:873 length:306 start_codon:yes stop_codon:yes gene_type:complete